MYLDRHHSKKMKKKKTPRSWIMCQYACMRWPLLCLVTCSVYRYGLPFVSPNNLLVSTINGTGAAIESIYVLIFIIFSPKKEKAKILGLFACVIAVFSAVAFVSLFALHDRARKLFCGFAATIFSIIMYASPLSIMVSPIVFVVVVVEDALFNCLPRSVNFKNFTGQILSFTVKAHRFHLCYAEIGDQDKERGVHAVFSIAVCVLVWHFVVHLWSAWPWSFCCCEYMLQTLNASFSDMTLTIVHILLWFFTSVTEIHL